MREECCSPSPLVGEGGERGLTYGSRLRPRRDSARIPWALLEWLGRGDRRRDSCRDRCRCRHQRNLRLANNLLRDGCVDDHAHRISRDGTHARRVLGERFELHFESAIRGLRPDHLAGAGLLHAVQLECHALERSLCCTAHPGQCLGEGAVLDPAHLMAEADAGHGRAHGEAPCERQADHHESEPSNNPCSLCRADGLAKPGGSEMHVERLSAYVN